MLKHKAILLMVALQFMGLPSPAHAFFSAAQMENPVQSYFDKQELYELNVRYARAVDRKDFQALTPLYADDAIHDHGGMFKGPPQEFTLWLSKTMGSIETQHLVGNSLFEIDGDTATGEVYTINFHHLPNSKTNYIAGGRYLDRYARINGKWRFQSRLRVIDWAEERDATVSTTAATLIRGSSIAEDPSKDYIRTRP